MEAREGGRAEHADLGRPSRAACEAIAKAPFGRRSGYRDEDHRPRVQLRRPDGPAAPSMGGGRGGGFGAGATCVVTAFAVTASWPILTAIAAPPAATAPASSATQTQSPGYQPRRRIQPRRRPPGRRSRPAGAGRTRRSSPARRRAGRAAGADLLGDVRGGARRDMGAVSSSTQRPQLGQKCDPRRIGAPHVPHPVRALAAWRRSSISARRASIPTASAHAWQQVLAEGAPAVHLDREPAEVAEPFLAGAQERLLPAQEHPGWGDGPASPASTPLPPRRAIPARLTAAAAVLTSAKSLRLGDPRHTSEQENWHRKGDSPKRDHAVEDDDAAEMTQLRRILLAAVLALAVPGPRSRRRLPGRRLARPQSSERDDHRAGARPDLRPLRPEHAAGPRLQAGRNESGAGRLSGKVKYAKGNGVYSGAGRAVPLPAGRYTIELIGGGIDISAVGKGSSSHGLRLLRRRLLRVNGGKPRRPAARQGADERRVGGKTSSDDDEPRRPSSSSRTRARSPRSSRST